MSAGRKIETPVILRHPSLWNPTAGRIDHCNVDEPLPRRYSSMPEMMTGYNITGFPPLKCTQGNDISYQKRCRHWFFAHAISKDVCQTWRNESSSAGHEPPEFKHNT